METKLPTFNDSFKSLIDLKNLKFDVGIFHGQKSPFEFPYPEFFSVF